MWQETTKNIILGTLLMATAACGWSDRSAYRQEVFSTDGAAIAGIHQTWEGQCKTIWACMSETKRNYQFQVWAEPKPNVQRTEAITPQLSSERFDGEAVSSSYVRNANHHYLLVTSAESDDPESLEKTFIIRQLQVGSNGRSITSSREIFRGIRNEGVTCDGVGTSYFGVAARAFPSRDGSTIAVLDQNNQCGSSSLTIKIIDAESLSVLREQVITPELNGPDIPPTWAAGWTEVTSDHDLGASGDAVVSAIQTETEFFNTSRGGSNYQALQSAYSAHVAELDQDASPQQVFVILDRGAFQGQVRQALGFYRAGTAAPSVSIEALSLNPVEMGQLRVQLRQEDATGGFYFESLEAFNQSYREPKATHVRFRRHIELSQQEASEFEIENDLPAYSRVTKTRWGIERLEEAKQDRKLGLYGATYWILNLDNANRTARGKLFCDAEITAFDVEGLEDGVQTTQGCFANEQDEFDPSNGYYEDAERRAIQWGELHWTFDSEGALRICEARASSEAELDAAAIDRLDLEAGCEGSAWLILRERTY